MLIFNTSLTFQRILFDHADEESGFTATKAKK